jgi:mannose-1-phosphate guanylyltransferase
MVSCLLLAGRRFVVQETIMDVKQNHWGIILAGGEGRRVQRFLAALCGGRGIKQYCAVLGRQSLLEETLNRVQRLIPPERVMVIVDARHRPEAVQQLAHWPQENILYQPANRETAPGILLPLAHISHRDPNATVVVFPSDHFVLDEPKFVSWVRKAFTETERFPNQATLLGMTPDRLEEGYGWIEPAGQARDGRSRMVARFREKPSAADAERLMTQGALWNTFVFAVRARALWDMARHTIPEVCNAFEAVKLMLPSAHAQLYIEHAYENMRTVNFSSGVLSPMASRLRVLAVPDVGWSDWGSVERILASARKIGRLHEIATRLKDRNISDPSTRTIVARFLGASNGKRSAYGTVRSHYPRQVHADI